MRQDGEEIILLFPKLGLTGQAPARSHRADSTVDAVDESCADEKPRLLFYGGSNHLGNEYAG